MIVTTTSSTTSGRPTTLGPFLTLLVLIALRGHHPSRERLATVETAPVEGTRERPEFTDYSSKCHSEAITLGPFLTLILTLHRRGAVVGFGCDVAPPGRARRS
jgi:hypothetical protein